MGHGSAEMIRRHYNQLGADDAHDQLITAPGGAVAWPFTISPSPRRREPSAIGGVARTGEARDRGAHRGCSSRARSAIRHL